MQAMGAADQSTEVFAVSTGHDALWLSNGSGKMTWQESSRASPALHISASRASTGMGEVTKSSFGCPHPCSIRGLNLGPAAGTTDPAEMLSRDRAGGALLLCLVEVTSVMMLKWTPTDHPKPHLRPTGMFALINTEQC